MRLIDADKFCIEELYNRAETYYRNSFESGVRRVLKAIVDAPTIDAVPVVRCKDCDHMEIRFNARFCKVWCMFNGFGDNGFCNYGYPKDGTADEIR